MRAAAAVALVVGVGAAPVEAQSVSVAASRWLTTPHVTDYRVAFSKRQLGPVALLPFGQLTMQGPRGADGATFAGAGFDVALRLNRMARPYLVGGVSAGFFDFRRTAALGLWHSWSAGVGIELVRTGPFGAAIEVRHQALSRGSVGGVSFGLRIGSPLAARPAPRVSAPVSPGSVPADARAGDVVAAARSAMGSPYRWGGNDANGFDCSGLIQYAYAAVGVAVPRRSVEQAQAGWAVPPVVATLAPGDILAFSASPGGEVSHVGLYLGDGWFVHSASGGVRLSALRADDPVGRWWFERWTGARRVIEPAG